MTERLRLHRLQLLGRRRARRRLDERESQLVALAGDADDAALGQLAEQQLLGERLLDVLLDDAGQRTRAEQTIVALLREPFPRTLVELDGDVAIGKLLLELQDELVDDAADGIRRQRGEGHDGVEPVTELRREYPVDRLLVVAGAHLAAEADRRLG